ncbi:MAG: DinB family protein [Phototrophicaceae bacterium]
MSTQRCKSYISHLKISHSIVLQQLDGLSNEDMLRQPQPRGNCANWVLGHIIASRHSMTRLFDKPFVWDQATIKLYNYGSDPITSAESPHIPLEALLEAYETSKVSLLECLEQATDADLEKVINDQGTTANDRISFMIWHESYHSGQFEYLRQLADKNDKVV